MKKVLIATAALCTALPFTFDGVTPTVSKAQAVIGRPLTPGSIAGVHRRAMRRTHGVGANLGYHPVARRAALAAAATGAGYYGAGYGGWGGGWGWNRPLFASAGWGWNRPLYSCSGPFCGSGWGWGGGWGAPGWGGGWGWRRW
jgi:hypothetical protein